MALSTSYSVLLVHLFSEHILRGTQFFPDHYCMFPSVRCGPIKHLVCTQLQGSLEVQFLKSIYIEGAVIQFVCRFAKCIHPGHCLSCFPSDFFPNESLNPPDCKLKTRHCRSLVSCISDDEPLKPSVAVLSLCNNM